MGKEAKKTEDRDKINKNKVDLLHNTDVSQENVIDAIVTVWQEKFGKLPFKEQVAILLAQISLETGNMKRMYNFNVGNITTDGKSHKYYDDLTTKEQVAPGQYQYLNLKYRAYPTLLDGVKDYINFLSSSKRASAWNYIENPDPVSYSKALKDLGYYTADEIRYTKPLVSLFETFSKSKKLDKLQEMKIKLRDLKDIKDSKKDMTAREEKELNNLIEKVQSELIILENKPDKSLEGNMPDLDVDKFIGELDSALDHYSEGGKYLSQQDRDLLPQNIFSIAVASSNLIDSVEFSNILCYALDDKLLSKSFVHTNGQNVEIECHIAGPSSTCLAAIQDISNVVADSFSLATKKIGSVKVKTKVTANKSSYPPITIEAADLNHRKFLLKFT